MLLSSVLAFTVSFAIMVGYGVVVAAVIVILFVCLPCLFLSNVSRRFVVVVIFLWSFASVWLYRCICETGSLTYCGWACCGVGVCLRVCVARRAVCNGRARRGICV